MTNNDSSYSYRSTDGADEDEIHTEKAAFLVDGEAYFSAFAAACEQAEEAIYILGWDIDSRISLHRKEGEGESLGAFIDRLVRQRPELHIYLLEWDFALFYALEREVWSMCRLGWMTHDRVHFVQDSFHPVGASHHQKIVVVDDRVAFVGGFDLACCRWDTSDHRPDEPLRADNGAPYGPFHDIQMVVSGAVARTLGDLCRTRWERASGDRLSIPSQGLTTAWPEYLQPDLQNCTLSVLQTLPRYGEMKETRQIEQFYLQAIGEAKSHIYIENQYLSSAAICRALEKVLSGTNEVEVIIVLPLKCSGWMEEQTMGVLRDRVQQRLQEADHHGRLFLCYPDHQGLNGGVINVHSKAMTVDDRWLTVGSANLSNRSMGFDTECNLALKAKEDQTAEQQAIAEFRHRLLAEHLGASVDQVAMTMAETGSLQAVIDTLGGGERSLKQLPQRPANGYVRELPREWIADPETPLPFEQFVDRLGQDATSWGGENEVKPSSRLRSFILLLLVAVGLSILWRWTPLSEWVKLDRLLEAVDLLRGHALRAPVVLLVFLIGSCLMFPVNLLILATVISFNSFTGFVLALTGSLLGGTAGYLLGLWLGRQSVQRLAGSRVDRISRKLAQKGWLTIALVRMVPIAPFTLVNMVAGASHISLRAFLLGTVVGMVPGITAIMMLQDGLETLLRNPGWDTFGIAVVAVAAAAGLTVLAKRLLLRRRQQRSSDG